MSNGKKNLVLIYTGNGKGKTTAALGLAVRSLRDKKRVIMVQFIKSQKESGEVSLRKVLSGLEIKCFGLGFVLSRHENIKSLKQNIIIAKKGIEFVRKNIEAGRYDVVILDEVLVAYDLKLISLNDILDLVKLFRGNSNKNNFVKCLILTGRGCPKSLYKKVDLVTEMKEVKHHFAKGVMAVSGIDY